MPYKNLIIARWNENVDWVYSNSKLFNKCFLYNKGEDNIYTENSDLNIQVKNLQNVGRETDSYFTFIVDNYQSILDSPDDTYIFSQAQPFDTSPNFLEYIKNLSEILPSYKNLADYQFGTTLFSFHSNNPHHPNGLPYINYLNRLFFKENAFIENLSNTIPYIATNHSATFATPGKNITFRKKQFYVECQSIIKRSVNPYECYLFERMWQFIFDGTTLDWISHYEKIREKYAPGDYKGAID